MRALPRGNLEGVAKKEHVGGGEREGAALQTPLLVVEVQLFPLRWNQPVPREIPPEGVAVDQLQRGKRRHGAALEARSALREDQNGRFDEQKHLERTHHFAFRTAFETSPREYRLQRVTSKREESTSDTAIVFREATNWSRRNMSSFPRVIVMFGGGYERKSEVSTIVS